ncbi:MULTISPECIES: ROK family transcriptional regulator [Bacillaceae]|uniref:ROK family transcriptional regulator n=1 Tax=Metabacillus sp. B2-18 TaxID=2897333 RepID=UPI000BFE9571|nr:MULTISPECIES: ROK family transcriptional regulator [Bacillaceae]PGT90699.1 ROK family protein [Bacillus sp. AFS040349]UGB32265.1 ROK family protein [Metabacillus sp. B2-18]
MSQLTWNQQIVKKNNTLLVFQTITNEEPISRADIAQQTGLNKATVSSLVNELLTKNLVYESGPGESSGGRRPVLLHYNVNAGYSIGIDLGVNYILGVVTDLKGKILLEKTVKVNEHTFIEVTEQIKQVIHSLIKELPKTPYGIIGIGLGIPGIVDKQGEIRVAPNLGWKNSDIKTLLEEEFQIPVIVENEANAGAYGEKQFGVGQDYKNIVYVSAGIGIGVGLILNNELYQGLHGFSGEMGHMVINMNGIPCSCGSKGCWEAYASEHALLKSAGSDSTLESLIDKAQNQDEKAIALFKETGQYIGYGINNIINTFNPEQIIIGNRLAMAQTWIKQSMLDIIYSHSLSFQQQDLQISFSKHSTHSAALGVAAITTESFIQRELQDY